MKITKYPDDMNPYKIAEDLARKECRVCPCCGRRESVMERWCDNEKTVGIIHRKTINYLSFKCWSCGAQWDSEPFETGEKQDSPVLYIVIPLIIYVLLGIVLNYFDRGLAQLMLLLLWLPLSLLSLLVAAIRNGW